MKYNCNHIEHADVDVQTGRTDFLTRETHTFFLQMYPVVGLCRRKMALLRLSDDDLESVDLALYEPLSPASMPAVCRGRALQR